VAPHPTRPLDVSSLTIVAVGTTQRDTAYTFAFAIKNPVMAQNSPGIMIESVGIPIGRTPVPKDFALVPTSPAGCSDSLLCQFSEGDGTPLKVSNPKPYQT